MAVDARAGELLWQTRFIPDHLIPVAGTANIWSAMSADPDLGLVCVPISAPEPNYWGGSRIGDVPYGPSVTAVAIETGEIVWSRRLVYHDIRDYDTPSPPSLIDLEIGGETVPVLVQTTKQAVIWVLDRRTGAPLFPIEERPVPPSDVAGEVASPVQPFVQAPPPTLDYDTFPSVWTFADIVDAGQCSRDRETYRREGSMPRPWSRGR